MDDVMIIITCFLVPLAGAIAIFTKSLIEDHKMQEHLSKTMKELGGNGFIADFGSNIPTQPSVPKIPKTKRPKLTNCKNCGAPLHGNKCEFCDTEYDW